MPHKQVCWSPKMVQVQVRQTKQLLCLGEPPEGQL